MTYSNCSLRKLSHRALMRWTAVIVFGCFDVSSISQAGWWQPTISEQWKWQLQLQGNLRRIDGVKVYSVDADISAESIRHAQSLGAKVMCYISAGSAENWRDDFHDFPPAVVGNAYQGWPGEWWLDIRRIDLVGPVMAARIKKCRDKGFDVLDPDNINGYENETGFGLTTSDAVRYIRWLAAEAHRQGMSFSLKNGEALIAEVADVVDMMQSESCFHYGNCERVSAMARMGKPVFAVEYRELISPEVFQTKACELARKYRFNMIYRDMSLTADSTYRACNNIF